MTATLLQLGERAIKRLPVRLTLLLLMVAIFYGFTRINRVEHLANFLACDAVARISQVDSRPCLSHIQRPEVYLPASMGPKP